jgi:hypothetical protein
LSFDLKLDRRGRMGDAAGEIVVGDFRAVFTSDLSFWDVEEYRSSWRRSAAAVLEHGFGRFLASIGAPGEIYDTWACWRRGDQAMVIHSILLASISSDFLEPEAGETYGPDRPEIDPGSDGTKLYLCSLADIADFERRLRGASAQ